MKQETIKEISERYKNKFESKGKSLNQKWTKDEIKNVNDMIESFFEGYLYRMETPYEGYDIIEEDGTTRMEKVVNVFISYVILQKTKGEFLSKKKVIEIMNLPIYPI